MKVSKSGSSRRTRDGGEQDLKTADKEDAGGEDVGELFLRSR